MIVMQKEAENVYINIRDAYESGMTHWKEALLVTFRQDLHPMVKDHVKFLIVKNKKPSSEKSFSKLGFSRRST